MLLRTTYESVEDWGVYASMAAYQKNFWMQLRDGYESFRDRYRNYDLSVLYNSSMLEASASGGVTNRFYFSFLNDAQFRVIGKAIRRAPDRVRFGRVLGDRLYRAIVAGKELRADVAEGDGPPAGAGAGISQEEAKYLSIGSWPALPGLATGADAGALLRGTKQLLGYLQARGYCEGFQVSDIATLDDGKFKFTSLVEAPVNLEATRSLMRSNDNFAPRYDQRILQAYFADRGFESDFSDELADGLLPAQDPSAAPSRTPRGIRSLWTLTPDPDAGL